MKKALLFLMLTLLLVSAACSNETDDLNANEPNAPETTAAVGEIETMDSQNNVNVAQDNGDTGDSGVPNNAVATVNDQIITQERLDNHAGTYAINSREKELSELDDAEREKVYEESLALLIETELFLQASQEYEPSDEEVQNELDQMISQGGTAGFEEFMKTYNLSEEQVKNNLRESIQINQYFNAMSNEVTIDQEELEAEYEAYKQEMEAYGQEIRPLEEVELSVRDIAFRKKLLASLEESASIEIY